MDVALWETDQTYRQLYPDDALSLSRLESSMVMIEPLYSATLSCWLKICCPVPPPLHLSPASRRELISTFWYDQLLFLRWPSTPWPSRFLDSLHNAHLVHAHVSSFPFFWGVLPSNTHQLYLLGKTKQKSPHLKPHSTRINSGLNVEKQRRQKDTGRKMWAFIPLRARRVCLIVCQS